MRLLSDGLKAHLESGATTLCHCWRVTRSDGVVMGFTDHDRDLTLAGTTFMAGSGFQASGMEEAAGLGSPASEVEGGLSSPLITAEDLQAGRYDGAVVEIFLVNWANPAERVALRRREIGAVTLSGGAFRAELLPPGHGLSGIRARFYTRACGAAFAGPDCGYRPVNGRDLDDGAVAGLAPPNRLSLSGIGAIDPGDLAGGRLEFLDGALKGRGFEVDAAGRRGGLLVVDLFLPLAVMPAAGDAVRLTVGCDRQFATCRERFGNGLNFRGFPHMPGADFAYSHADRNAAHDGSALIP